MNYSDALAEMLIADMKIRRKGWKEKRAYLRINGGKIYKHNGYGFYDLWNKPLSDIRANDWVIHLP